MSRQKIHFAPANSFPAQAYNKIFRLLETDFEIGYLDLHAHDERFPVTNGWRFLAEELRTAIEKRYGGEPVIGVGHSLGGILQFLAAAESPHLYKSLILLDAPLTSRLSGAFLRSFKRFNLMDKLSPSKIAVRRRNEWESKEIAFRHFSRVFRSFDKEMIADYVQHGLILNADGKYELKFKPEIEAEIYRTVPDDYTPFRGRFRVPAVYIGGTKSREAKLARLGFMRRNFGFKFYFIEGSHHFPFQRPAETANLIHKIALNGESTV
jgi:pimeloyl-ACP methyl ester carboxylesterase